MANLAQMVNVIAPIMTNEEGYFLQPTYFPLVEYGKQRGNTALHAWVSSPTYEVGNRGTLGYLDVSATYDPGAGRVYLNVLNRNRDRDITARVENQKGRIGSDPLAVWEMNHPDLKATHTFGDDERVRPVTRAVRADVAGGSFDYTFPAHSLTILQYSVR
jgi:alpha-L-arabinofuranosidase